MLAEALCKLEGFTYAPSETVYWQQGAFERDFMYVTTQTLGREQLAHLSEDVGPGAHCYLVRRVSRRRLRICKPDAEEDSQPCAGAMRMGP